MFQCSTILSRLKSDMHYVHLKGIGDLMKSWYEIRYKPTVSGFKTFLKISVLGSDYEHGVNWLSMALTDLYP